MSKKAEEVEKLRSSGSEKPQFTLPIWGSACPVLPEAVWGQSGVGGEWPSQTGLAHLSSCAWHGDLVSKQLQWVTDHLQIVNDRFVLCVSCHRRGGK